jgi:tetratricopeptide (TPR) repeat protein
MHVSVQRKWMKSSPVFLRGIENMNRVGKFKSRGSGIARETIMLAAGFLTLLIFFGCQENGSAPSGAEGPHMEVQSLLSEDRIDEAERILDALDEGGAQEDWALFSRGEIALKRAMKAGDPKTAPELQIAQEFFQETLVASPDHYMAKVSLGRALSLQGELVTSVKHVESARDSAPHRPDAYFELGRIYAGSGQVDASVKSIEAGLDRGSSRADGFLLYGEVLLLYRKQIDEALKAFRTALQIDPDIPGGRERLSSLLLTLGVRALNKKKYDDVLRIVDEVLELSPDSAQAYNLRGQVFILVEETGKAVVEFRKCVECDTGHREGKYYLARALIKEGYRLLFLKRRDEALGLFREAVDLEAPDVDLTVVKRILEDREKPESGEPVKKTASSDPEEARVLFEEATALLEAGKAEDALGLLQRSIKILPKNPYAHHQAGLALDALDRRTEAEETLKLALDQGKRMGIDLPATYLKLAELAIKGERYAEAKDYLEEHDERFPDQVSNPIVVGLRRLLILADK